MIKNNVQAAHLHWKDLKYMRLLMNKSALTSRIWVISSRNLKRWRAAYIVKKPQTLRWVCWSSSINCVYCCLKKLYFSHPRVCRRQLVTRVCKHYPMFNLHVARLCNYNGKSLIAKSRNITWWEWIKYRHLVRRIRMNSCWRATLSILDSFSNNVKLINCMSRHSFSQYNEFNNLF